MQNSLQYESESTNSTDERRLRIVVEVADKIAGSGLNDMIGATLRNDDRVFRAARARHRAADEIREQARRCLAARASARKPTRRAFTVRAVLSTPRAGCARARRSRVVRPPAAARATADPDGPPRPRASRRSIGGAP